MKRLFIYAILMIVSVASNVHAEDNVRISVVAQDTRQWKVEVTLESESPSVYCGFQMDMLLLDGVIYQEGSLKAGDRISDYNIMLTQFSAENLRVLSYSPTQQSISAGTGNLFTLLLSRNDAPSGNESLVLKNIRFSDATGKETTAQGVAVDLSTGVLRVLPDEFSDNAPYSK